jgi:hypothetical protein
MKPTEKMINPIWEQAEILPIEKKLEFSIILESYIHSRNCFTVSVEEIIMNSSILELSNFENNQSKEICNEIFQRLVNSYARGILKSAEYNIGYSKNISRSIQFPDILYLLSDLYRSDDEYRDERASFQISSRKEYSNYSDKAKIQVMSTWLDHLQIRSPSNLYEKGFSSRWNDDNELLISKIFQFFGKMTEDELIYRAEEDSEKNTFSPKIYLH